MSHGTDAFKLVSVEAFLETSVSPDSQEEDFGNGIELLIFDNFVFNICILYEIRVGLFELLYLLILKFIFRSWIGLIHVEICDYALVSYIR